MMKKYHLQRTSDISVRPNLINEEGLTHLGKTDKDAHDYRSQKVRISS